MKFNKQIFAVAMLMLIAACASNNPFVCQSHADCEPCALCQNGTCVEDSTLTGCSDTDSSFDTDTDSDTDADTDTDTDTDADTDADTDTDTDADTDADSDADDGFIVPGQWVTIPAGGFWMGTPDGYCPPDYPSPGAECNEEAGRGEDENLHFVEITYDFEIMDTEVTQEWFEQIFGWNPSTFGPEGDTGYCGSSCPVESVSWFDGLAYANALSEIAGLSTCYVMENVICEDNHIAYDDYFECMNATHFGIKSADVSLSNVEYGYQCTGYRLPNEAEWEYAARAETLTSFYTGEISVLGTDPLDFNLDEAGWYAGNSSFDPYSTVDCTSWYAGATTCGPQPVSNKAENPWFLFDVHGNVYEWLWDVSDEPYASGDVSFPVVNPENGVSDHPGVRGGSWNGYSMHSRVGNRNGRYSYQRLRDLGLRIVRSHRHLFVDGTLEDSTDHDGRSWEKAFTTVQEALVAAQSISDSDHGGGCEIWVRGGQYVPTTDSDRSISFRLKSNVALYGGFAGEETSLHQRDITSHETVLSGDIGVVGDSGDNSYHVVVCRVEDDCVGNVSIDGFTITGGNAGVSSAGGNFTDIGGGVWNSGHLSLSNCKIADNQALERGGGVHCEGTLVVNDTVVSGNSVIESSGGGIYVGAGQATINNTVFARNSSGSRGGAVNSSTDTTLHFDNAVFVDNTTYEKYGGAIYLGDDGEINNCIFSHNNAEGGGAVYSTTSGLRLITNCIFVGNKALEADGGALRIGGGSDIQLINSVIAGNWSTDSGGGLLTANPVSIDAVNCLFAGNRADTTGHDIVHDGQNVFFLRNSIVWNPLPDWLVEAPGSMEFVANYSAISVSFEGTGNISGDSGFVGAPLELGGQWTDVVYDSARFQTTLHDSGACWEPGALENLLVRPKSQSVGGDWRWAYIISNTANSITVWGDVSVEESLNVGVDDYYEIYDLRLADDSPCIDSANSNVATDADLLGNGRVDSALVGNTGFPEEYSWVDMGPYEWQPLSFP